MSKKKKKKMLKADVGDKIRVLECLRVEQYKS